MASTLKALHQLDLILTRHTLLNKTHSYQCVDCDTDHSCVCCRIRMQQKKFHHARQKEKACIDTSKMPKTELKEKFAVTFEKKLGIFQSRVLAT